MNGPEHYTEAERIMASAEELTLDVTRLLEEGDAEGADEAMSAITHHLAAAQVHATLALVAATANAERQGDGTPLAERPRAWDNGRQGDGATWSAVLA